MNTGIGGMAYSDALVLTVLKTLIEENGDGVISQSTISNRSGVPLSTTQLALRRLRRAQKIRAHFIIGIGYRYEVVEDVSSKPAGVRAGIPSTA